MQISKKLYVTCRDDWRMWLGKNYDVEKGVWLVFYKKHTGKPRISYDDVVEEALCFGWIDSTVKRIDDEKFMRKFTPRKGRSKWSTINRKRARKMMKEGKMTEAGLAKIREAKDNGEWFRTGSPQKELVVPPDLQKALMVNKKARDFFNSLANTYRRHFVGWIAGAKRKGTRERRLNEAIKLLEQNQKLGMK